MKATRRPKDKLFETAARLFSQHGYRATGVDTIAAESGIGKMTLYRHYPSKDALIVAFLEATNKEFWNYFAQATAESSSARETLLAFFRALGSYAISPACHGCPFLNIASEYPQAEYPGHHVAREHKRAVRERFEDLARQAGARHPEALASGLILLMDGMYMAARMYGTASDNPATHAVDAAHALITAHCDEGQNHVDQ